MRVVELFAGIGGCAHALPEGAVVCQAVDQSPFATQVYAATFPDHPHARWNLAGVKPAKLDLGADLWWLSPPCQPFTIRGQRKDIDDPRSAALVRLLTCIEALKPPALALENVPGFETSRMRSALLTVLERCGYDVRERLLCPTELGIPMRRRRYYLVAARNGLGPDLPLRPQRRVLLDFLDPGDDPSLDLPEDVSTRFAENLPISDPVRAPWVGCFTGAYGKSPVFAGSYWKGVRGPRYFSEHEIARLMGFGDRIVWPADLPRERRWKLLGNSLSVDVVRVVLRQVWGPRQADGQPGWT